MAEVYCGSEPCPLFLNSTCVFYTGESLLYIGVQNNDTLETIIVKINQAFQNAGVGYAFTNGLIQPTPFQPVQLGGALTQNTTIGGNFTLTFAGNVQAAKHITTGGSSSQFVKGDGTLDSTAYQPAANYITGLSGDATASGPGVAAMTLSTVNFAPGTFGNGNTIPIVTVNAKGLVTNITPVPVTIPPLPLNFIGDVVGSGFTGSSITLLMQNVNANPYNTITPLKFSVNGKGLVTGASPITASDIVNILGYYPGTSGTSGSDGTSGTSGTTGTSGTSGTSATSGTSGTTGTSGTSATSGTSGTSGTDGTGGTSGTSGSTGTSGTSGTSGTAGTSGTSGTTGTSGSSGTSGSTGTSGSSGTTGTSGSSGTTGTSGSSGTSGTTGTSGSSGTSGTTGLDGTNGTSGTSGTTGTSGSSGTSGTSATSGSSGTSGTTGTSGTSGLSGDRFKTTSTTTYTLQAPGNPGTLTVDPGLAYTVGQSIIIAYDANNHNEAEVTSYDSITGVINFVTFTLTGSGTYSSWFVNIDGASGGDGSSGTSGTAGTSGSSGTSGTTGTSGSSGTSGTSATDGTSGSSGTSAIDGTSGTSGTSGTTGTSGSSGTSGTTGTSGSSGTSGTSATDGTGGTSGTSGSSGTSGTTGTSGTSATSGTSGTSATSGTTGTSGTSGVSGTGGSSGTSGTSATSGTSGTSGATGASGTSGTSGTSVAVSGTTNTMAKFTSSTTIGNSALTDDGSTLSYPGSLVMGTGGTSYVRMGRYPASTTNTGEAWIGRASDRNVGTMTVQLGGNSPSSRNFEVVDYAWSLVLFSANSDGNVYAASSMRAPLFYDVNDTNYYIDGASTSILNALNVNSILVNNSVNIQTFNTRNLIVKSTGGSDAGILGRGSSNEFAFQVYGSSPNYGFLNSAWGAWDLRKNIGGPIYLNDQSTYYYDDDVAYIYRVYGTADMRSPLYYDLDNTGYYLDPASTSNIGNLQTNTGPAMSGGWNRSLLLQATYPVVVFNSNGSKYSGIGVDFSSTTTGFIFWVNGSNADISGTGTAAMNIHTGNFVSAAGSFRAPIFYDSDNTGYYLDATSTTSLRTVGSWRADSAAWDGEFNGKIQYHSNHWYFQSGDLWIFRNSGGSNVVTINQSGVITAPTFSGSLSGNASTASSASLVNGTSGGAIQSWDIRTISPSSMTAYRLGFGFTSWANNNSAPYADYLHLRSYSDGSGGSDNLITFLKSGFGMRIWQQSFGSGSAYSSFVDVLHSSNYSSYALPLSGGTLTGPLTIGTSVNSVIWNDGTGTYMENTGTNSSNRTIRLQAHNGSFSYTQLFVNGGGGYVEVNNQMRAPIFYDSGNTAYYVDPASGSRMNSITYDNLYFSGDTSYGFLGRNVYADTVNGRGSDQLELNYYDGGEVHIGASYTKTLRAGVIYSRGANYGTVFYDTDNTGYYLDPNSGSYLYSLVLSGNSYFRPNSWIQLDGIYGIFSPVYNNAHFLPNTASSYGNWRIIGNRNGYDGIYSDHSAVNGIMYDSSGNGGPYREANGRWYFYYHLGNDCMGIGTSSTSSTYSLYLNKGVYAQSRIDATIYYDSANTAYYLDPNGASYLASSLEIANGYVLTNGVGGAIYVSSAQGSFGGYVRFAQHAVIESINGGYHIYVLDASGIGVVKYSGNQSWSAYSDGRIKTIHSMMQNNLSKLDGINPIYYSFNNFDDDKNRIGLIAQEVQQHFPELVDTDPKTDNLTLDYIGLIPVLLGAIKELKTEVETLKTKI